MAREPDEHAEVFSIGSVIGGRTPGNRAWREEIAHLAKDVVAARAGLESPLNLNIVFHVAGHLLRPEFEGVRTGAFRVADRLLMVQIALPDSAPANPRAELLSLLQSAVAEAERWSKRKGLAFDHEPFVRILSLLTRGLASG